MLEEVDRDKVVKDGELVPKVCDLRCDGFRWLRIAYIKAVPKRVPRESQIRLAVTNLRKKLKLCTSIISIALGMNWLRQGYGCGRPL